MHTGRKGMKWGQHIFGGEERYRRKAAAAAANTSEAKRALRDNKKYNKKSLKYVRKVDGAAALSKKVIKNLDTKPAVKNILNNPASQQHQLFMEHVNQQNFQNMINNSIMVANQNLTSFMNTTIMANNTAMTMHMMHF